MRRRTPLLALSILLLLPAVPARAAEPPPASETVATDSAPLDATDRWIVVLGKGVDAKKVRDRFAARSGVRAERLYQRAISGFSARLTKGQVAELRRDPQVVAVVPDEIVETAAQVVPTGVARIGTRASTSTVARIDGIDQRVNADVAIVDTGIDASHPDLNVVGGVNCSTSNRALWRDVQGHGTHVAGTVGAIDNGSGVVGVAPGVRLWAVKILNDQGAGLLSWYICGLDWIAAQRDPKDASRPLIESVNMSVAKWGKDTGGCGVASNDLLHQAICRVTKARITVGAAAANDSGSASARVPAAYNEVITVSALADGDGKAGGLRGTFSCNGGSLDIDDSFGNFSNYGGDVDIIAPGKCIWSTLPGNRYGFSTGTSMAAPAVAGAVALYKASRPWASPAMVKASLQLLGTHKWFITTDPDSVHEKLLDVSRLGPAGTFDVALAAPAAVGEAGGAVTIPIKVTRSTTHFETLRLTGTTPPGFAVTIDKPALSGFTANSATLKVTVPPSTPAGTYEVKVSASEGARVDHATTLITVENDAPTAAPPAAAPATTYAVSGTRAPIRVTWAVATDPTSRIVGYEVQYSLDLGPWSASVAYPATATSFVQSVDIGHSHRFRVRARDAAGNWSAWAAGQAMPLGAVDDRSISLRWSGTWTRINTQYAYKGTMSRTTQNGASVRLTLNARTIAIVSPVGPTAGWLRIYVDGVFQREVSLYAPTSSTRRVVWVKTFPAGARKLLELRAVKTASRYRVDLDAILVGG